MQGDRNPGKPVSTSIPTLYRGQPPQLPSVGREGSWLRPLDSLLGAHSLNRRNPTGGCPKWN